MRIDRIASRHDWSVGSCPGIFGLSGVFTDPQFQVVIRALNQKKGIDLAFCAAGHNEERPARCHRDRARVSLSDAIRPNRKMPDIQGRGSGNSTTTTVALPVVGPSTPSNFETRNTGVTLEVEPVVGPDGVTIDLNLVPQVVEFEGFINYGSPISTVNPALLGFLGYRETSSVTQHCPNRERHQPAHL